MTSIRSAQRLICTRFTTLQLLFLLYNQRNTVGQKEETLRKVRNSNWLRLNATTLSGMLKLLFTAQISAWIHQAVMIKVIYQSFTLMSSVFYLL